MRWLIVLLILLALFGAIYFAIRRDDPGVGGPGRSELIDQYVTSHPLPTELLL
jgi:hypothetical protein